MRWLKNVVSYLISLVLMCFFINGNAAIFAPESSDDVLSTPHRGFMVWGTGEGIYPDSLTPKYYGETIYHIYLPWRLVEPNDQQFDWQTIEKHYLEPISRLHPEATFVLRLVADYPDGENSEINHWYTDGDESRDYPLFLEQPPLSIPRKGYISCDGDGPGVALDWNHPNFAIQAEELITALAKKFDGDARITTIQLGLLGMWGEWHQSGCENFAPKAEIKQKIVDAYKAHFKVTPLQMRYASPQAKQTNFGFHEDFFPSFTSNCDKGLPRCNDSGDWNLEYGFTHVVPDARDNWKVSPISGESPLADQKNTWINSEAYKIVQIIQDYHFSFLGPAGKHQEAGHEFGLNYLQNQLGYRFQLNNLQLPSVIKQEQVAIDATLEQVGSAPSYFPTTLMIDWLDQTGTVVKTTAFSENLQSLLPAQTRTLSETHTLGLADGIYELRAYLLMQQPVSGKPIALANKGRDIANRLVLGKVTVKKQSYEGGIIFSSGFETP